MTERLQLTISQLAIVHAVKQRWLSWISNLIWLSAVLWYNWQYGFCERATCTTPKRLQPGVHFWSLLWVVCYTREGSPHNVCALLLVCLEGTLKRTATPSPSCLVPRPLHGAEVEGGLIQNVYSSCRCCKNTAVQSDCYRHECYQLLRNVSTHVP